MNPTKGEAVKTGNPLIYLFSKTWHYSAGNRHNVVLYWSMFVVANIMNLIIQPLIWAKIMYVIQQKGITLISIKTLFGLLLITLFLDVFFWAFHGPGRVIERTNAFKAKLNYWKYILKGVMTLPMEWHVNHHSGNTIDKSGKGVGALHSFGENSFEVIAALVQLVISYVMLCFLTRNFSVPLIVLVMIMVTAWIVMRFDRVMIKQYQKLNHAENNVSESVYDAISNITTVIILRVEKLVFDAIVNKIEKPFALFKSNAKWNEWKWFLVNICCTLMTIFVLGVYFWQNLDQEILIGSLYLLIQYLGKINELFFKFASLYSDIVREKTKVMNADELAKDFRTENFTNHVLPAGWQRLEISQLNFSYHSNQSTPLHLEDISLSLNWSEKIALVGESGSGKTTLLKVMRDLYHPQTISLAVNGVVIPEGFAGIARAVALVPQDPEIFATTILENITLGADHTLSFVRRFTDMACLTEVIESLPKQFDSSIKEKGVNLSGGQQQRLALARGLLACDDKSILLFDEPTSSLDTATEMKVYRNIFRYFAKKTIVSSVHKLHLLPLFDCIYLFSKGRIIASGTLAELLFNCPEFQELWRQYHEHHKE